jgi:hypothetical protein
MSHRGACFVHQSFLMQEVAKSSVFMHISSYANNPNLVVKKSCVSKKNRKHHRLLEGLQIIKFKSSRCNL